MVFIKDPVTTAAQFACVSHRGQRRKWVDEDYIQHPARVAMQVSMYQGATDTMVQAAWCHDVIEDCGVTFDRLETIVGVNAARLVLELTNPSKNLKGASRAECKAVDRLHIQGISHEAKIIKLFDRLDNMRSAVTAPASFIKLYTVETRLLLTAIAGTDAALESQLLEAVRDLQRGYEFYHE